MLELFSIIERIGNTLEKDSFEKVIAVTSVLVSIILTIITICLTKHINKQNTELQKKSFK